MKEQLPRFYFLEEIDIFGVMVRFRNRLHLVFSLNLVSSKFKFSSGIQLFGMKTTSYGNPDLKNSFLRSDLRCGDFRVRFWVKVIFIAKS